MTGTEGDVGVGIGAGLGTIVGVCSGGASEDVGVGPAVPVEAAVGWVAGVGAGAGVVAVAGRAVGAIASSGVAVATVAEVVGDAVASRVRVGVGFSVAPLHATVRNATAAIMPTKRPLLA